MRPEGASGGALGMPTERIKYRGIFDFDRLLSDMKEWFDENNYEFHEKAHKFKVPLPSGAEKEIKWVGWRAINPYVKFWINVYFHIWDFKPVEVVKEGKKAKLYSARMLIEFSGTVELDYSKRFAGSEFLQNLQDWYLKYIAKKKVDNAWTDELYYMILKLFTVTKQRLDMETTSNAAEGIY